MCGFLRSGNNGYAAYNFNISESIVVVRKNEKNREVTFTAYWSSGGTTTAVSGNHRVADVEFSGEPYYTKTSTVTIVPHEVGSSIVKFTNNVDALSFNMMIIVID